MNTRKQNPVLKLVLAKHPELLDKSIEELEAELDAKFDRTIRWVRRRVGLS